MTMEERLKEHPDCSNFYVEINLIGLPRDYENTLKFWLSEEEWHILNRFCPNLLKIEKAWLEFDNTFIRVDSISTISFKSDETTIGRTVKRFFYSMTINF